MLWSAAARADCPGPDVEEKPSAPAKGVLVPPFPRKWLGVGREFGAALGTFGEAWRRAMEDALEKDSAAGNRPLEGSGEEDVGKGQGFDVEGLSRCSDMAPKSLSPSSE